ncbi:MAG: hypothetical protein R2716_11040 [Microthrixaceae bacterium]
MPIIGSLFEEYTETTGQDPFTHQNKKLLKVHMGFGPIFAKLGSMVASRMTSGSRTPAPAVSTRC